MKLELKHLAPYLPYGLMCEVVNRSSKESAYKEHRAKLEALYSDGQCVFYDIVEASHGFDSVKPILQSIESFANRVRLEFAYYDEGLEYDKEVIDLFCHENTYVEDDLDKVTLTKLPYECVEYMFKKHVDVFGLIEKGLAVDINTIK